jgi:hypothetical protein
MQEYFKEVKNLRNKKNHTWKTEILVLKSNNQTKKAWHDAFLWPDQMQIISDMIGEI